MVRYFSNWDFFSGFCYWNHYLNSMTINQQIDDSFVVFQFFDSHVWLLNNSFLMIVLFTKSFSPLFILNQTEVWSLLQIVQMEVWFHFFIKTYLTQWFIGCQKFGEQFLYWHFCKDSNWNISKYAKPFLQGAGPENIKHDATL